MAVKVLTALDLAKTQYYHFKAIMIAGMGMFTDAYDLFCITPVNALIGRIYYEPQGSDPGVMPPAVVSAMVAVSLMGTIIGNLVFGALGDRIGRRRVYGLTLLLMVSSSFACGFSLGRTRGCVLSSLCFFRFLLGIGIGGDYPLSATIMSEFANKRTRGSFIAAVFSMQGFGILASSAVTMAVTRAFDGATEDSHISPLHTPEGADLAWRIILMMGAIPAALTFYWRMAMPETARYTALVEHDEIKATDDMGKVLGDFDLQSVVEHSDTSLVLPPPLPPTYGLFSKQFLRRHGRDLFACSMAWFLVDVPYYSNTLFQSLVYEPWFPKAQNVNAYVEAYDVAKFQAIIAVASTIPGYFATMYFIDRIGRRKIQMMGFLFMAIFIFALAGPYDKYWHNHTKVGFIILYGFTFFFSNFGPNTTTFIVPAELFPARFRSTCHGISGAAGKVGAMIGAIGFLWASRSRKKKEPGIGMMNALIILGGVCVVGTVVTYFFTTETMMRSLEENEGGESNHRENDRELNGRELPTSTTNSSPLSTRPIRGWSPLASPL
ncbi:probable inorganic phosphate transporter 1-10 [Elaeis guineensis]|uniref:H(+)/Pi cotransporter n=1 Tax=Elaeis guineensis var. tenera TaxID=51953 RepID=A0A6I9SI53_ELAGV|nr:probable inorganic phosphate transporter 1-10 [Elaeis guineensis]